MIVNEQIDIKIYPSNINYWKNKNYNVNLGDVMKVNVYDLPEKSNISVLCKCDVCNKNYFQRFSRNKDVCGSCRTSMRMKNNKGQKNKKTIISSELLEEDIKNNLGKNEITKKYNISISVLNRHLNIYKLKINPYQGKLFFKTEKEEKEAINKINSCPRELNISEISKQTNVPRHIINKLRKENKVKIESQFDSWKKEYEKILKNIEHFKKLNEKHSLKDISQMEDVSIEHLKKSFNEKNIPVKLHSYNKSKGELECRDFIRSLNFNCHSIVLNKKFEIDCFVYDKNFGVEYCGEFWHRYVSSKNNKNYHKNKYEFCKSMNDIKLMTIFECEWKNKREIIESMIKCRLGINERIFARKCKIKLIPSATANKFHENNHMSGKLNSNINIGLYFNDELYSVISFIKSRFDKNYEYEIARYSTKKGFVVVGGLSKMFSFFVDNYNPKSCMTYADLRFGEGNCYKKIGFSFLKRTNPNYYYFQKNGDELESRMKYQKHKTKNLVGFDPNKSEFEIMSDSGYYRIYDCGNNKYGWIKK
jgi:hypothetical protein